MLGKQERLIAEGTRQLLQIEFSKDAREAGAVCSREG